MAKPPVLPPRPSKISVPMHCHPLAKVIFAEMARQRVTYVDMEWRSGVLVSTIKAWRQQNRPGLETIEACLGVLGFSLLPVPEMKVLPPHIAEGLRKLAEEWGDENELLMQLMLDVCRPEIARARPAVIEGEARNITVRPKHKLIGHPGQVSLFQEDAA